MEILKPMRISLFLIAVLAGSVVNAEILTTTPNAGGSSTTVIQSGVGGNTKTNVDTSTRTTPSGGTSTTVDTNTDDKGSTTNVNTRPNPQGGTSTTITTDPSN